MTTGSLPANLLLAEGYLPIGEAQFDKSFTFWQVKALSLGILNFSDGFLLNAENCRRKKTISLLSTDLHLQTATIAIAKGRSCTLTVTVEKISQSA
ncbi:hypothetical protein NC653_020306 [Populus alba x Populus x berolinensis]|uniref:Uncharacterized protein n=1 Tax=Populus alba x Populus x berolinensis TaxID=444605 RepID=A0AAD6MK27_9ROSI|nr:hypothetical protein NC653_020306 [Populus alba x Populus x berolinensis]